MEHYSQIIKECNALLIEFKKHINSSSFPSIPLVDDISAKLKLLICQLPSLPPCTQSPNIKEYIIKREFLETNIIYSLLKDDLENFEINMIELRGFYTDSKKILPSSEKRYGIIGLYLLFLIYKNRTADYYTELELLSAEEQKSIYISVAVSLEQYFIDGNYFKILHTKQNVPMQIYNYFIDKMIDTVRQETARSAEKAYKKLLNDDAYKLFLLNSPEDLKAFVEEQKTQGAKNNVAWVLTNDSIFFEEIKKESTKIPNDLSIARCFEFTNELVKIV